MHLSVILFTGGGACSGGGPAPGGLVLGGGLVWGVPALGGLVLGGLVWGRGAETPQDGYCCGQYASYWNAFLLFLFSSWDFSQDTVNLVILVSISRSRQKFSVLISASFQSRPFVQPERNSAQGIFISQEQHLRIIHVCIVSEFLEFFHIWHS